MLLMFILYVLNEFQRLIAQGELKDNKIKHNLHAAAHDTVYTQLLTQSLLLWLKFHLAKGISLEPQVDGNAGQ